MTPESASIATLAIFIIALLLHLLIMIWVISAGVKSGIKSADWWNQHHLMVNNRLLITLLVNNGVKAEEIKALIDTSEDQFWSYLIEKGLSSAATQNDSVNRS